MAVRLDVYTRIDDSTNRLRIAYPTGAAYVAVTLPDAYHATAVAVAAALSASVNGVSANLSASFDQTTLRYTIASAGLNFDVDWPETSLREILGFASPTYANVGSVSSDIAGGAPHTWRGAHPVIDEWVWVRRRKVAALSHGRSVAMQLAAWREWSLRYTVTAAELVTLRRVASYLARGLPVRLWRDATVGGGWAWATPTGYSDLVWADGQDDWSDGWLTEPHQTYAEVRWRMREYVA